jgi:hypothetical protein
VGVGGHAKGEAIALCERPDAALAEDATRREAPPGSSDIQHPPVDIIAEADLLADPC